MDGLAVAAPRPSAKGTIAAGAGDNSELVSPMLRAGALAIIVFQIGYAVLDKSEYPQTFAQTVPLHGANIALGLVELMTTLSPCAMRIWRANALAVCSIIMLSMASIGAINSNSDVLVASIVLFFFGAGALVPWSPRWQAALGVAGALALLGYSMQTADPNPRIAISWTILVSAALLSQLSAVHSARYRQKLAEQLTELAENHRLLRREMDLRAETASALERDHERLQASEAMLRKVFEASPDNIAINRLADGRFIAVNDEFRVAGYTRADVMGDNVIALGMWPHEEELTRFLENLRQTGRVKNMEITQRRKDGTAEMYLTSASVVEVNGEPCVISMTRDITEIKRVESGLRAAREAALAASRAKSEFLSSMSHEIRTPMNAILGMADLLMETELADEQRRYLSTVISNGHALLGLINGILDFAMVESGRISLEAVEFDPKDVTEKALETLAIRAHEKGLELMARFAPGVPELVLGDPFRLGQILINLVGNAIKFTQHGQVLVSVEPDPNAKTAGALKFTVSDTGIGIPADKLQLLFHAFTQADSSTSRKYGGSGLGLAIVARLVALMEGKVEVASEPEMGSRFSFTAQFGTPSASTAPSGLPQRGFAGVRILLVDDNSDSRLILSELLTAQGAEVTQASSGTEALSELGSNGSPGSRFQIVLLDSAMPAPDGFDVAKHLVSGAPGRPQIVMMLGINDMTGKLERLRAIGVANYIVKPVRRAELFAAVARACNGVHVEPRGDRFAAIAPASASSAILDRPLQILLADDSYDNRALIRAYLKQTPYRLEEAEDGRQAIDKFIAAKFDLVLMDVQMPIVDGYKATATIRAWERANVRRRTPIVALTASALEEAMHRTRAAGCDAHITKPVRKSTLLDAIRNAIERSPLNGERADAANLKEETCPTE